MRQDPSPATFFKKKKKIDLAAGWRGLGCKMKITNVPERSSWYSILDGKENGKFTQVPAKNKKVKLPAEYVRLRNSKEAQVVKWKKK
jgi:hypothetical protein